MIKKIDTYALFSYCRRIVLDTSDKNWILQNFCVIIINKHFPFKSLRIGIVLDLKEFYVN